MSVSHPDPTAIMRLATGYWNSATLLAANELALFGALADGPQTARRVAEKLQTAPRPTEILLDACAGLGLVQKESLAEGEARYHNAPNADAFLVPGRPGYLGDAIRWGANQYAAWGELAETVRTDKPAVDPALHLGDDPQETRDFVLGMHNRALGVARGVVPFLDLAGVDTLLDVGGGPGTYATLLAQKYPTLHVTVLDLPGIVAVANELIAQSGVADRVQTFPGSAMTEDFGEAQYDALLFSGVLHQMSPDTIRGLFAKGRRALKPGGRILVSDMMLDATKTQPVFSILFSVQMLLTSAEGAVFATDECAQWLQEAGLTDVHVQNLPPPLPYAVVTAVLPK